MERTYSCAKLRPNGKAPGWLLNQLTTQPTSMLIVNTAWHHKMPTYASSIIIVFLDPPMQLVFRPRVQSPKKVLDSIKREFSFFLGPA